MPVFYFWWNIYYISGFQFTGRLSFFLVPTSSTSNYKDLSTFMMDMICIDCSWSKSNETNWYSLCCKHIQIALTCEILCKCYIFFTDWKYVTST